MYDRRGGTATYDLRKGEGSHGGGDERLLRMLFRGDVPDTLGQCAGSRDGVMSILMRLRLKYGDRAAFYCESGEDGTVCTIRIPGGYIQEKEEEQRDG